MQRTFYKIIPKDFKKDFQNVFTNMEKHDIINISNETTTT